MKTDVEELSPTRVKLTIEVPFEELKPSLDKAYREVSRQVRIPGFRPGHVPPRIIDQRLGRGAGKAWPAGGRGCPRLGRRSCWQRGGHPYRPVPRRPPE